MGIKKQSKEEEQMEAQSHYGKVTEEVMALLTEIVGDKNVLTGDDRYDYSRDETLELKPVLLPKTAFSIIFLL